ncbi:hypothetical protein EV128_1315 [Rhizobium azibense]|nr:hypothetical protein EV128_1315 [Rhizobium azibense]
MGYDHRLSSFTASKFGGEKVPCFLVLPIGMDRAEFPVGKLLEFDAPVIVYSDLGCRHRKFRIASTEAEVGP